MHQLLASPPLPPTGSVRFPGCPPTLWGWGLGGDGTCRQMHTYASQEYMHTSACRHMHINTYPTSFYQSFICIQMHGYACMCIHMEPSSIIHTHAAECNDVHAYADTCIHAHTCAYIRKHMYTNSWICVHMHLHSCAGVEREHGPFPLLCFGYPSLGGGALYLAPDAYIHLFAYKYIHVQICALYIYIYMKEFICTYR